MAIHSTCEWSALTLSILVICVLYILFASVTYFSNTLKKNTSTDTNHTKNVSQTMESTTPPINPKDVSQKMESTITPINPKEPFTRYKYPSFDLLKEYEVNINHINEED